MAEHVQALRVARPRCRLRVRFALVATIAVAPTLSASANNASPYGALKEGWVEIGGFGGNQSFAEGEVDAFVPLMHGQSSLLFMDFSGETFDHGSHAGNLALGYREKLGNGWNVGGYVGGDFLHAEPGGTFYQGSAGLEVTSRFFDLRINGYLPDGGSHFIKSSTASSVTTTTTAGGGPPQLVLQGNQLLLQTFASTLTTTATTTTTTLSQLAYPGFDGEIGLHGVLDGVLKATRAEVRLYAGGFYYRNDSGQAALPGIRAARTIAGSKARMELAFNDILPNLPGSQLTLEAQYSYDNVRRDQEYVGLRLLVPFAVETAPEGLASGAMDDQEWRLHDRIRREREILVQDRIAVATTSTSSSKSTAATTERVEDAATDVPIDRVAFANATTGITALAAANGANTLIVADGSKGTIAGPQVLLASQTLIGGGSALQLQGLTTGTLATFTAPGTRPTLLAPTDSVLTIASNNHIVGLNVSGTSGNGVLEVIGNVGIAGPGSLTNVVIEGNALSALGERGISLGDGNSNVRITDNTISNVTFTGLLFGSNNANVAISNNQISDIGGTGIAFFDNNTGITIANNTISDVIFKPLPVFGGIGGVNDSPTAIFFNNNNSVSVSGNTITHIGATAAEFGSGNNLQINGNSFADIGGNVFFPGGVDLPPPVGAGGPFAIVIGSSNAGSIANNSFAAPITTAVLGTFDAFQPGRQGSGNAVTGTGNVLSGTPAPTACGHFLAAGNPASNVQFTDGSHCP